MPSKNTGEKVESVNQSGEVTENRLPALHRIRASRPKLTCTKGVVTRLRSKFSARVLCRALPGGKTVPTSRRPDLTMLCLGSKIIHAI